LVNLTTAHWWRLSVGQDPVCLSRPRLLQRRWKSSTEWLALDRRIRCANNFTQFPWSGRSLIRQWSLLQRQLGNGCFWMSHNVVNEEN